jgi:hypothetical protein
LQILASRLRDAMIGAVLLLAAPLAQSQVVVPIAGLKYDAPVLPPTLWATTVVVTRELALLPLRTLAEKANSAFDRPYRWEVLGGYQRPSGQFGSITVDNGSDGVRPISFQGDVYSAQLRFAGQWQALSFGLIGGFDDIDVQSFAQQRLGAMPYGRWTIPLGTRVRLSLLGTFNYFDNQLDSHLAPREFSDYASVGGSFSVALHFDTETAYRAVTVTEDGRGSVSLMGSVALTYHLQSDDAKRQVVYQQTVADEVDNQRLTVIAGNIGMRIGENTAMMIEGEYATDLSDYGGSLTAVDDGYGRVNISLKRTIGSVWEFNGNIGRTVGHDVDVSEVLVSVARAF